MTFADSQLPSLPNNEPELQEMGKVRHESGQFSMGLFSGILVLAITMISLIMFFELVSYKDYKNMAIFQVHMINFD